MIFHIFESTKTITIWKIKEDSSINKNYYNTIYYYPSSFPYL